MILVQSLICTAQEEVKLTGYKRYLKSNAAPPPLTAAEAELEMVKKTEVGDNNCFTLPTFTILV
jgi:hypothetical protein